MVAWTAEVDTQEAANLLSRAALNLPAEAAALWEENDGLPTPQAPEFAHQAAGFMTEHAVPAPDQLAPGLWDTRAVASRQCKCLAYLASGKKEARPEVARLCVTQAMRLQWGFPIYVGHARQPDRTFYAATGALAFTGGLLRNRARKDSVLYEVATQWLRTATGQFATYGEGGNEVERRAAQALINCADVKSESLEIHSAGKAFFAQIDLGRSDMREVARYVSAGEWDRARTAYVEVLAERFAARQNWPDIHFCKTPNIPEADDICRNVFILQAHMFRRCDFGAEVDWAKVIDNDIESRVWMNAHPWMWTLVNAYRETHDEKYVQHLCRLFNSWYEASPPPLKRSSAQWRTLEAGGRVGQRWSVILLALAEHPRFRRECLVNMACSMLDHGKYLCMYAAGGGNWLQVESSGLACIALFFPEFKLSPLFYQVAMNRLTRVNARSFLPDGFQSECSPGYHRFPLIGIASALRLAKFLKAPVPECLMKQYEAGVEALQFIVYPDLTLPMLSDVSPQRQSAVEVLQTGAEVFGREDFRWFATEGREGRLPTQPSHDFTHAGYCVMRDKWGADGQVLIFDAGYFGAGHQHEDKLNFVFYGGGRELIGDPGIYSYKSDEFEPYWRGTWSHNTVVVDDLSQHRALGPPEDMPDPDRRFVIGEGFDFAVGWYRRAWSPRGSQVWQQRPRSKEADKAATTRDVQHQRCIFYVKGEYAIICDRVTGKGEHQVDTIFHPAPVIAGEGTQRTVRAVELEVGPNGVALTKERGHANVAIIPAQGDAQVLDLIGQKNPVRGWFALYGIQPSHDIVYRRRTKLPARFEFVLEPLPPGQSKLAPVTPRDLASKEGNACSALAYGRDLFLICYDGPAEMTCADVQFQGTALLLRRDTRALRAYMVDGKRLALAGRQVFSSETPAPAQVVEVSG